MNQFYLDNSMRLTPKVIELNDKYYVVSDRCGYTAKRYKHKTGSMGFIAHVNPDEITGDSLESRLVLDVDGEPY